MMENIFNNTRVDIGGLNPNIAPHWAYYIAGSFFIVLAIISMVFTYYAITRPISEEKLKMHTRLKRAWLKNRIAFYLMADVICVLSAIIFMINGS
ncbi:MAG: hypothetical protein ACRC7B_02350 [Metamycoplasmataceae bacterium]